MIKYRTFCHKKLLHTFYYFCALTEIEWVFERPILHTRYLAHPLLASPLFLWRTARKKRPTITLTVQYTELATLSLLLTQSPMLSSSFSAAEAGHCEITTFVTSQRVQGSLLQMPLTHPANSPGHLLFTRPLRH